MESPKESQISLQKETQLKEKKTLKEIEALEEFVFKLQLNTLFEYNKSCHYGKIRLGISRKYYKDTQLIRCLIRIGRQRLKWLGKLVIHSISRRRDYELDKFMLNSFPLKVEEFWMDDSPVLKYKPFTFYSSNFIRILPWVTRSVGITGFVIKKHHFENIVNNSKHLKYLEFCQCTIDSEGIKFRKDKDFKLKRFNFSSSGAERFSNWKEKPNKFISIVRGIAESGLKDSIEEFCIRYCCVHQNDAKLAMERNGIFNVMVVGVYDASHHSYSFFT